MTKSDGNTVSTAGVAYPEWPRVLGDPRWHPSNDIGSAASKTRADIIARFREQRPEVHTPVVPKQQLMRVKEQQQEKPIKHLCSFQVACRRGTATKKCHHCIQFDPLKLGYYCEACFDAHHPSYRLGHSWVAIENEVDYEQNWMTHLAYHNLEQDARELVLLLSQTQSFLSKVSSEKAAIPLMDRMAKMRTPMGDIDFHRVRESVTSIASTLKGLVEQVHTELEKKPLTREDALVKIQTMWRIRKARKQMRELIQSVHQSFTDPSTGMTYYVNTKTKTTQWSKPKGLGTSVVAKHPSNQEADTEYKLRVSKLQSLVTDDDRHTYAAKCIQGMARTHAARRHLRRLISSVYEKIWDANSKRFYYHNTKTKQVKWEKPRWVSDDDLLTPRTRHSLEEQEEKQRQLKKVEALRSTISEEQAACMVQRAYRRKRGFVMLLEMCRGVYERIYDAESDSFYYHNTRTKEVSWDKPLLLRGASVDVYSPRTRQQRLQSLLASAMSKKPPKEWTEESAAIRLQGLFRARRARRELDQKLAQAYKKVWDASSEQYYYANLVTGGVSWDRPAILLRRVAVEIEELRETVTTQ